MNKLLLILVVSLLTVVSCKNESRKLSGREYIVINKNIDVYYKLTDYKTLESVYINEFIYSDSDSVYISIDIEGLDGIGKYRLDDYYVTNLNYKENYKVYY